MKLFLLSLTVVGLAILGMAVGVIISNKKLKGSCGGLGAIMGEDCMFCDKKEECEEEKKREAILKAPLDIDSDSGLVQLKNLVD
ncbi:MAG: (Na+)-NQR maturation NqrM [Bdellovibrionota bacterium]|jgi:hypothetical protein|nr:(Na+)-NQR maturation NqrM [Bdellovibrionota bacterium]